MAGNQFFQDEVTVTYDSLADAPYPTLGIERQLTPEELQFFTGNVDPVSGEEQQEGEGLAILVFNDDAAEFTRGSAVIQDTGASDPFHGVVSGADTPAVGVLGFAQGGANGYSPAFTTGRVGWVLKRGVGYCLSDDNGADQGGAVLAAAGGGSAGGVDVTAAAHEAAAWGLENAAAAAGALFRAHIKLP